jgi:peroxiredoxin
MHQWKWIIRHMPMRSPDLSRFVTSAGESLLQLSRRSPVMLVFLRHAGCTFCREALADLGERRRQLEARGVRLALVHMSPPADFDTLLEKYGLGGVLHISDPEKQVYQAFGLGRGNLLQLFGPNLWARGFQAMLDGHGVGKLVGDGFQMPGLFVIDQGEIVSSYIHRDAGDRPDYCSFIPQPRPLSQ